jgi:hypothetical protein
MLDAVLSKGSNNSQLIHPKLQNMQQKAPNTTNQASRPPSGFSLGSNTGSEGAATTSSSPTAGLSAVATPTFSSSNTPWFSLCCCSDRSNAGFEPMTVSCNDECEDCDPRLCCSASIVAVLSAISLGFWNTGQRETSKYNMRGWSRKFEQERMFLVVLMKI